MWTEALLDEIKSRLCELPLQKQLRYVKEYNLSDYDAGVLTSDRSTADFFDQAVQAGGDPKRVCNLITQTGLKITKEKNCNITDLSITPQGMADLAKMVEDGTINASSAVTLFEAMVETGKQPDVLADELNLIQKSDASELESIVDQVLAENAEAVAEVTSGGKKEKKARGFLMGQVMQKSKGQANPKIVSEILAKKLK